MNHLPLFRVRSWNNDMLCMSFYILFSWWQVELWHSGRCKWALRDSTQAYICTSTTSVDIVVYAFCLIGVLLALKEHLRNAKSYKCTTTLYASFYSQIYRTKQIGNLFCKIDVYKRSSAGLFSNNYKTIITIDCTIFIHDVQLSVSPLNWQCNPRVASRVT